MAQRRPALVAALAVLAAVAAGPALRAAEPPPPPAIVEKAKKTLALVDQDRDGRASLVEYAAAKLKEAAGGAAAYKIGPKTDNYWKTLDSNKDGIVTPDEFGKGPIQDEFRAIDANKDGFLDAAEVAAALVKVDRAQKGDRSPSFVERYDLDKDGKVTRAEWPGSDAVFSRLDATGDGVIDAKDAP